MMVLPGVRLRANKNLSSDKYLKKNLLKRGKKIFRRRHGNNALSFFFLNKKYSALRRYKRRQYNRLNHRLCVSSMKIASTFVIDYNYKP